MKAMKKNNAIKGLLAAAIIAAASMAGHAEECIYVYHQGSIVFKDYAEHVDSVALENNKTQISIYDTTHVQLYSAALSYVDSIKFADDRPVADLLDVVFNPDGSARDISPMGNTVEAVGNNTIVWDETYKRYTAHYNNPWATSPVPDYYKIDYDSNTAFKNGLSDGHTLETVFMTDYEGTITNAEAKWFSSHQSGGTGFLISTISGARKNEITFLPNVNTTTSSKWIWCTSGIVPQPKVFYHVVGVWDKAAGKAYVYVNGELKNTVAAVGNLRFPNAGSRWFGIGGDPNGANSAQAGAKWEVVTARVYNDALTQDQVTSLWRDVKKLQDAQAPAPLVTDVDYMSGLPVKAGGTYSIYGNNFKAGDKIAFTSATGSGSSFIATVTPIEPAGVTVQIPAGAVTDSYLMTLSRGDSTQVLGGTRLEVVDSTPAGSKVIAHRGFWLGTSQNSRQSLLNAQNLGVYGSETDVWLTTDNHLMINHDAKLNNVTIQTSTYDQVKDLTLSNGEKVPQLSDFLAMLKSSSSPTKLIIEIKAHSTDARTVEAADSAVAAVKRAGVQDKVEYISFSLNACAKIAQLDPQAKVSYLNGNVDPDSLHTLGITGLDYKASVFTANPTWVTQAHNLGMTCNAWTINTRNQMAEVSKMGIDFLTTDYPVEATAIKRHFDDNH